MGAVHGLLGWESEETDPPTNSAEDIRTTGTGNSSLIRRNVPRRNGEDIYDDQKADEVIRVQTYTETDERCSTVNQRYADGQTPLTFAIRQQEVEQVRALLADPEVDVNFPELRRYTMYSSVTATPLLVAAQTKQMTIMRLLLEAGANVNATHELGSSALHMAAEQGSVEGVQWLLQYRAGLHFEHNMDDPLHRACQNGHLGVVEILIAAGSNINPTKSALILSPLSLALHHEREDVAFYLLQHGASFELHSQEDPNTRKPTVFLQACRNGSPRIVKYLIDAGVDRDVSERKFASGFHYAVRNGDLARIARDKSSHSLDDLDLECARDKVKQVFSESVAVFEILCESGGDLDPIFKDSNNALVNALVCWNIPACFVLLKHGASWSDNKSCPFYSGTTVFRERATELFELDPDLYMLLYDHAPRDYIFDDLNADFQLNVLNDSSSHPSMFPVPSLKHFCRRTLRECVKTPARHDENGGYVFPGGIREEKSILPKLLTLPLPRPLVDYLCYSELDLEQLISNLSKPYLNHMLSVHS